MGDRVAVMRNGFLQQIADPKDALRAAAQPVRRRVHRLAGDEPRRGRRRAVETATSGSRSARTGCASSRRHSSATRASRPTTGERSCSGSGPRTWRTRRSCVETHPDRVISVVCDIREDMGSEVYVHFNVPADPVTTRRSSRRSWSRTPRTRRRGWPPSARAAGASSSSPGSSGRRRRGSAAARARGRRHAAPLLRSRDGDGHRGQRASRRRSRRRPPAADQSGTTTSRRGTRRSSAPALLRIEPPDDVVGSPGPRRRRPQSRQERRHCVADSDVRLAGSGVDVIKAPPPIVGDLRAWKALVVREIALLQSEDDDLHVVIGSTGWRNVVVFVVVHEEELILDLVPGRVGETHLLIRLDNLRRGHISSRAVAPLRRRARAR